MEPTKCSCFRRDKDSSGLRTGAWHPTPDCRLCNGTGKVWASVGGEIVAIKEASGYDSVNRHWHIVVADLPHPGTYRIIVQPLKEGEVKPCKS